MKRLDIKISFQCNNHCKFCVQGDRREHCHAKPAADVKAILKESRSQYNEVVFTGGEPTIQPNILEYVNYAAILGYTVLIQSNGRMFAYPDFCKKMIAAGAGSFTLSIHGNNAKLHDSLTESKGSFAETRAGIKQLLSLRVSVDTNTVITTLNYKKLPDIADMLTKLGVGAYRFSFPHILGSAELNYKWLIPRKTDIVPYLRKAINIGVKRNILPFTEAIPRCFLTDCPDCAIEKNIPDTKIFDDDMVVDSFTSWRVNSGKIKSSKCKKCKYFSSCEGPWREYPKIFGWSEFIPVKGKRHK